VKGKGEGKDGKEDKRRYCKGRGGRGKEREWKKKVRGN